MIIPNQERKTIFDKGSDVILAFLFVLMIAPIFTSGATQDSKSGFSSLRFIGGLTVIGGLGYGLFWLYQHISIGFVS